jgi:hypothetical protein
MTAIGGTRNDDGLGELVIRDLLLSFVSSPCDQTIFVEQVSSQPFTAEHGVPMAIAASSARVH